MEPSTDSAKANNATFVVVGMEAEVCRDIERRQQIGIEKYGTTVAENPLPLRKWLEHAYEETLDKAIYLKRAIAEIDSETNAHDLHTTGTPTSGH